MFPSLWLTPRILSFTAKLADSERLNGDYTRGSPPSPPPHLLSSSDRHRRQLTGRINKCGVISPRFDMPLNDVEKWVNNLLPARGVSYLLSWVSEWSGVARVARPFRARTGRPGVKSRIVTAGQCSIDSSSPPCNVPLEPLFLLL